MSAGKGAAVLGVGVVGVPALIVMAISGAAPPPVAVVGGGLNGSAIPAALVPIFIKAGGVCPGMTAPDLAAQDKAESGFNADATSGVGALGIAQFMPATWKIYGKDYNNNGTNSPLDPGDAIIAQAHYMCDLYAQVGAMVKSGAAKGNLNDLAWAAYNAGPGAVQAAGGVPQNGETPAYIAQIHKYVAQFTIAGGSLPAGANLAQTVKAFAWPTNMGQDHLAQMPAFAAAVASDRAAGRFVGYMTGEAPGRPVGDHCSATVSMIATRAVDPSYNFGGVVAAGAGFVPVQKAWMATHWTDLGAANSLSPADLRPGDVGISDGFGLVHVWMYVGSIPGFSGNYVEGSYEYAGHVGFAPQARQSATVLYASYPTARYYRKK